MTLGDILAFARFQLNETDNQGRFSDAQLAIAASAACRAVSMALRFPEFQMTTPTVAGQREYTLPEVIAIKRVYVAGQLCPETSIPTMQGEQIDLYDQTAPNYQTQWQSAPNASYPVASDTGYPVPNTLPYYAGVRPMYYQRGQSVLGIQPPPAGVYTLQVEGIAAPPPLVSPTDQTIYSSQYLTSLGWYTIRMAAASGADSAEIYEIADREYYGVTGDPRRPGALAELRDWLESFMKPQGLQFVAYRSLWSPMSYRRRCG